MTRLPVILVLVVATLTMGPAPDPGPTVTFADDTPADLRVLAKETWERFAEAFPARRECLRPISIQVARKLEDRATYDPSRSRVTIRIPGTAGNLRATLVHEFAHHLEFTCPAQRSVRSPFLVAQGLPKGRAWFHAVTWEKTPSEQFAEAAVEVVLRRRSPHSRIPVTDEAVGVIRWWATHAIRRPQ
jgi:hypothetical protein